MDDIRVIPKSNISVIPSRVPTDEMLSVKKKKRLRVAAYCRVSTEQEEQESSFETQIITYSNMINENPDWILVDIYKDYGITGTMIKKRDDFKRLMKDAMQGKIDFIITKSVSRFGRNTVETLTSIRKLREKGINVKFEKENVNTMKESGDLLLTILAGFAQEESRSLSENVKWGKRRKMKIGDVHMPSNLFGYSKNKETKEEFIIVEHEAKIIRNFNMWLLLRYSFNQIRQMADEEGYKTRAGKSFTTEAIIRILENEKYAGDYLAQKTFSKSFLTKEKAINNGELQKIYIKDHHNPIISHEMRNRVIEELKRRKQVELSSDQKINKGTKATGKYPYSNRIKCADCGHYFNRKTWKKRDGSSQRLWKCSVRMKSGGLMHCKNSMAIDEESLLSNTRNVFNRLFSDYEDVRDIVLNNIKKVMTENNLSSTRESLQEKAEIIYNTMQNDIVDRETLERQLQEYEQEKKDMNQDDLLNENQLCRLEEIRNAINVEDHNIDIGILTRKLINNIIVHEDGLLEYEFFNGYIFKTRL